MKALLDTISSVRHETHSLEIKKLAIILVFIIGIFIAIYAITIDPNNVTAEIGFPP
jgi:hypothetical protein